jgi:hypothetical protein
MDVCSGSNRRTMTGSGGVSHEHIPPCSLAAGGCAPRSDMELVLLSPARLPFRHSRDDRTLISVDGRGGDRSERSGTRFRARGPLSPARDGVRRTHCDERRSGTLKAAVERADARGMGSS